MQRRITFWLRVIDRPYWEALREKYKPSEILSRGIELAYLDLIERKIKYDDTPGNLREL